ncbi:CotS family spore coat protein [Thermobrachium celere]|uniref:Spore coat protein S n=1 Tax=Thermobrachium celere DSM 8682 TaxID=941824 RepID=R7RPB8_9CLOT|nr:CotS family spore coat protein [Thermobrachium celere]CDF57221.1 Spore coat protein S [Thermobrachium celere DSM 8682]
MFLEKVEKAYGFNVESYEKIKNIYKLITDRGIYCLKVSKYDLKQYNFIISAMNYLIDKGYEHILPIYKTIEGENYLAIDDGYAYLTDFIDAKEVDFKDLTELKMCIEAIAKLHLASRGFKYEIRIRDYYGRWIEKFKKRSSELLYFRAICESKDEKSEFDSIFLKYFDLHYRQSLKCLKDFETSNYFKIMESHKRLHEICHHDTANHNFLITHENIVLIDYDYVIMDTHLHDLASLLIRNLRYGNWDIKLFNFILNEYSRYIPITLEEIYLIFCFMEFPQDYWQVGLQYYVEKQPWTEENFLKRLNRVVLDAEGRFKFLSELEGLYGKYR